LWESFVYSIYEWATDLNKTQSLRDSNDCYCQCCSQFATSFHWSIPLDLELGAVLTMVILFGWWAFPGLLLASYFTSSIFLADDNPHAEALLIVAILKTITPYIALTILKLMRLDNFFADSRISYQHLAVLILLTVLINIIAMYFATLGRELSEGFDLGTHLSNHIAGAILGSAAFFAVFIVMHKALAANLQQNK